MDLIIARLASRFLRTAGVFEAPPKMVEQITALAYAQAAANHLVKLEEELDRAQNYRTRRLAQLQPLLDALRQLKATPTSWQAYKDVYDNSWVFGHPGTRRSIRDFQKLTPEKKAGLEREILALVRRLEERAETDLAAGERDLPKVRQEINDLQKYTLPGVRPLKPGDSLTKKFPIDLDDWKYGGQSVREQVRAHHRQKMLDMQESMLRGGGDPEKISQFFKNELAQIDKMEPWKEVTVVLSPKMDRKGVKGYWSVHQKTMVVELPFAAMPWQLAELQQTVRHELQHLGQDLLSDAVGLLDTWREEQIPRPGLPSRHIMTPEYQQGYDPKKWQGKDIPPDVRQKMRELKQRGVNLSDLHALDDVEFYTRLADSIDTFQERVRRKDLNRAQLQYAIKLFTGAEPYPESYHETEPWRQLGGYSTFDAFQPDHFFKVLLRSAKPKWRKAVSEFIKAVT